MADATVTNGCILVNIDSMIAERHSGPRTTADANDGMVIEIDGLRRNYTTLIPARLFWDALSTAGLINPVKTPVNGFP